MFGHNLVKPVKTEKSGFFKIQVAVAVTLLCDFFFMIYAGAFDCPVLLVVPAPDAAGAVRPAELCLIAHQSLDHGHELLLIGIEGPAVFMRIAFGPFEHISLFCIFFCHGIITL